MEIEGEDGTKLILKPGDKTVFGRGAGFTTDDLTVSRRHVSLELKPLACGIKSDRVSFEVLGRNPVWVRNREPGEKKIRTFRKSETGEIAAGDRFCVSGQLPVWFTLKSRGDEATEERASGSESGLDCIDADPVKEFGFLVIGKEFDQYPKSRVRDIKQWEWFLEDSTKGNSDDDDEDDGDKKRRLSKKRRRGGGKKGNEEDDDWSAESEEDKELLVKSKRVVSPTYSTRSKKTKKDINASTSSLARTKQRGRVDIDDDDDDDDDDDETLGGFIVSDEETELDEEDEDDEELVEDDED